MDIGTNGKYNMKSLNEHRSILESIKYKKGKTYQQDTSKDRSWVVFEMDGNIHISINISPAAGWSTDVYYPNEMKLMDTGREKTRVEFKSGNIDNFAKKMYDTGMELSGPSPYKLTAKDYGDILRLAIDMGQHVDNIKEHDNYLEKSENFRILEKKEGHVSRKIKFDIDIESTKHALERLSRHIKDGGEMIDFKDVNALISKATPEIIDRLVTDKADVEKDRFVIQSESDGLTCVGIVQPNPDGDDLRFVVVTLYKGKEFRTGKDQDVIKI